MDTSLIKKCLNTIERLKDEQEDFWDLQEL